MQEPWQRGASPHPRSGAAAERSYHTPEGRGCGREEQPHFQGAYSVASRRAEKSYSKFKVRRGSREKIPLVRGKEQWLHFAGANVKRYPTSEVRETQVTQ